LTGICGFTSEKRGVAIPKVETMLDAMKVRGSIGKTSLYKTWLSGEIVIGTCWGSRSPTGGPQRGENLVPILDGSFFPRNGQSTLNLSSGESVSSILKTPGCFAFLAFKDAGLVAVRDPLGQKPLYWGADDQGGFAFASLKLALTSIGIQDPSPVVPGQIIAVTSRGPSVDMGGKLATPQPGQTSEGEALDQIEMLLIEAVKTMVPKRSALAFSGGLDSAMVATACKKAGLEPELVTVGLKDQPELAHARETAVSIGLSSRIRQLSEHEIIEAIPAVVRLTESASPVTVGISTPFYLVCKEASELGFDTVVAGQLSDELFGGYARFEDLAAQQSSDKIGWAMWESVLNAAEGDFAPGDKIAASLALELRCPFAYLPLVNFALQLPVDLRVHRAQNVVTRKYILRKLADRWGLPPSVVSRPKKAFQYSSGVQKILHREARRRGQRLSALLETELKALQQPSQDFP
jgi:asparagine synthase (glutamine-hydrolysing)